MVLIFPTVMLILNVSSVAVLWFGAGRVDSGQMQIGSLTAFLMYLMQILMSVMMATFMAIMIPRAAVCAERIREVLDTESSVAAADRAGRRRAGASARSSSPTSRCATRAPRRRCSATSRFRALPGQTTAVIGSTGAGKTTLVSLVPRLFDVTGGAVLVDGVDVRDMEPEALWRRIGLVPQKAFLFTGTVASNLRYGDPDADDDELWEALEVAQARDFVEAMPGGLEAPITQGGSNLSGGQRQRLAIARALVRRPQIYLFDDSFSALDLATDARLRAALAPRTREATVVIVAQRVSTIADADQIIVLEDGAGRRQGHPRGAAGHLRHLPGDRRVPARPAGGRVSTPATAAPRARSTPRRPRRAGGGPFGRGPMGGMGMPAEKAMTFKPSAKRLLRRLAPERREVAAVLVLAVRRVSFAVAGPKLLGRATDIIFAGVLGRRLPAGITDAAGGRRRPGGRARQHRRPAARLRRRPRRRGSTSAPWPRCCCGRSRCTRGVGVQLAAGLPAQRRRAAHRPAAALRRRGQAAPAAAALLRPAAARRAAEPGHQRHRQRRRRRCSRR